jgi:hypothetical protein
MQINNQGDVLFRLDGPRYYNDRLNQELDVKSMIIANSDPDGWFNYVDYHGQMSDVDLTDFGWLVFRVDVPQSDGAELGLMAILIPEIFP